jgi:phage/plasmid-associated DNA primase
MGKPQAGAADPDLSQLEGLRGAYMAETSALDKINVTRLKDISERRICTRSLYKNNVGFDNHCVTEMYTNHLPSIPGLDGGAERRISVYTFKRKFGPSEKNTEYETYAGQPEYASALFAILMHYRMRLRNEFNDDWERVPSPTITTETQEYLNGCDPLINFVNIELSYLPGFHADGTSLGDYELIKQLGDLGYAVYTRLSEIAKRYRDWYRSRNNSEAPSSDIIETVLINSKKLTANVIVKEGVKYVAGIAYRSE